jgi:hypothetical protein
MIILVGWVITEGPRTFKSHPQSAPGDFYVVNGECISCGAPHAVAPDLIGWAADSEYEHCIWKKQPETQQEMEQAFDAFAASCISCYRYAGTDRGVMERIGFEYCDNAPSASPKLDANYKPPEFQFTLQASRPGRLRTLTRDVIHAVRSFGKR